MVQLRKQGYLDGYELRIAGREFTAFGWGRNGRLSVVIQLELADLYELRELVDAMLAREESLDPRAEFV